MPVDEYLFAPKDKPVGPLPLPTDSGKTLAPAAWAQFTRLDIPMADRNRIVLDETGAKVWEVELRETDRGGYSPNTCRNEAYRDSKFQPGETMAWAGGIQLPSSWQALPLWSVLWQMHYPWDNTNTSWAYPAVTLTADGGKLNWQNNADGSVWWSHAYDRGSWHYFAIEIVLGRPGRFRLWYRTGLLPDASQPPTVDVSANTSATGVQGYYAKSGMYRSPGSNSSVVHVHRRDAEVVSGSAARALQLLRGVCRPAALGAPEPPPPPPPPPGDTLPLTIFSETDQSIVLSWTPPADAVGYRFRKDGGKWSHTWDGTRSSVKFGKPYTRLEVEALGVEAKGDLP